MTHLRRLAAATGTVLVALTLAAGPALAGGGDDVSVTPGSGDGSIGAGIGGQHGGQTGTPGSGGSGRSPYVRCATITLEPGQTLGELYNDSAPGAVDQGRTVVFNGVGADEVATEAKQFTACYNQDTNQLVVAPVGEGIDPQVIIDFLIDQAYRSVALPYPTPSSSPAGDAEAPLITQLPTLLWLDPGIWAPVSVTPDSIFGITVTVTAEPAEVTFNGGGGSVTCAANTPGGSESCALTYHHSSAVGSQDLSATMDWDVTWVCEPGCGGGTLPGLSLTDTNAVLVAELEAVGQNT